MECAGELDWVAKLKLLTQYRDRDDLDWDDAKLHLIDLQYADVRPDKGLYHRLAAAGRIERLLDDATIEAAMHDPPVDTRAYFRGRCLDKYADSVAAASWDSVIFDLPGRESLQRVPTIDPLRGTRAHVGRADRPQRLRPGPRRGDHPLTPPGRRCFLPCVGFPARAGNDSWRPLQRPPGVRQAYKPGSARSYVATRPSAEGERPCGVGGSG